MVVRAISAAGEITGWGNEDLINKGAIHCALMGKSTALTYCFEQTDTGSD
jgi:hypothetical protein